MKVAGEYRQKLAGLAGRVGNGESLNYLISAAHKMENHCRRTVFLLDMAEGDQAKRERLKERCGELIGETRVIADEMDALTHGGRLNADGADTSGYGKVLASLEGFNKTLGGL
jgi:hypothetical protein